MKQSSSFFGSTKEKEKAIEMKQHGNTHYKDKRYHSAVKSYTQALFHSPWPLPQVLDELDECMRGLHMNVTAIMYHDLLRLKDSMESRYSLPSLLGQCYGNRSAALYELGQHEAVVLDIDRALFAGFKKPQVFKLYKRKASSLAQLGRLEEARRVVETYKEDICSADSGLSEADKEKCEKDIIFINSEIFLAERQEIKPKPIPEEQSTEPALSPKIGIEKSPKVGRHIVAVDSILKGDCIIRDSPHVSLLNTEYMYTHCAHCFKECLTLIPCTLCIHLGYCSYKCMRKSFRYHWLECKNAKEWAWMPWIAQLAMRMIFLAPKQLITALIKEGRSSKSIDVAVDKAKKGLIKISEKDLDVLNLTAHRGKYNDEEQRILIEKEALRSVDYFKQHLIRFFELRDCHARTLYDLLRYNMCQLRFNTTTVSVNALATLEDEGEEGYNVRDLVRQKLGNALYLKASLLNHSCDSNVFFRFEGSCLKIIAPYGASVGDEMVHCYGPQIGRHKKAERQAILRRGFMFTCTCEACFNPSKDMVFKEHAWDGLSCPECEGVLPVMGDKYHNTCLKCNKASPLHKFFKQRDEARELYKEAMHEKCIVRLLECEMLQKEVLHSCNLELAKTRDSIAYLYISQGEPDKAFEYTLDSFKAVKDVFGIISIEAAEELAKLTQLLYKRGSLANAVIMSKDAIDLLELYHGPDHMDVIQLKTMKEAVELSQVT